MDTRAAMLSALRRCDAMPSDHDAWEVLAIVRATLVEEVGEAERIEEDLLTLLMA